VKREIEKGKKENLKCNKKCDEKRKDK